MQPSPTPGKNSAEEAAEVYSQLKRTRTEVSHQYVPELGARFHSRKQVPWTPADGGRFDVDLVAHKPPARSFLWVVLHPLAWRRERRAWHALEEQDRLARERADAERSLR